MSKYKLRTLQKASTFLYISFFWRAEGKSLYWKTWNEHGVNFVQDLLQNTGMVHGSFISHYIFT